METNLLHKSLYKKALFCVTLLATMPVMLYAQESGAGKNQNLEKLIERRNVAQTRVDKAEADRKSADSLIADGDHLNKEGSLEMERLLDEQDRLEKRVFNVELPAAEKQIKSQDPQERKAGMERRNEIRKEYSMELKELKAKDAEIRRKLKEGEKNETRGKEKLKLADKAWKDAVANLKAIEKEIGAIEGAEKTKEREAQQAQKKKDDDEAAKQRQKEETDLKKQKQKDETLAKREAEKAKINQEREKAKSKDLEKREKEKAAMQKEKEKVAAKREADKEASRQKREKTAKSGGK